MSASRSNTAPTITRPSVPDTFGGKSVAGSAGCTMIMVPPTSPPELLLSLLTHAAPSSSANGRERTRARDM